MSTFAEWKKSNKVMDKCIPDGYKAMAYLVANAAYKAGLREGRINTADALDDAADGTNEHWICSNCAISLHNMAKDLRKK